MHKSNSYHAHGTAIISEGAVIGEGTTIGPYSIIGPKVVLGKNNKIASHVVIEGKTTMGDGNIVYQFASIGSAPQDQKWEGQDTEILIGNGNQIREYVTLQPSNSTSGITKIGDNNLFMISSHIAHDVIMGSNCWIANSASVAGHVEIGNRVIIGGLSGIHQFVRLGDLAFIGAGSMVAQDVPPFCIAQGDRAKLISINKVGLQRAGHTEEETRKLQTIFRKLFYQSGNLRQKLMEVEVEFADSETDKLIRKICDFVQSSARGIAAVNKNSD
jgi:UDP-N-acetylglucosamine acyltransferase